MKEVILVCKDWRVKFYILGKVEVILMVSELLVLDYKLERYGEVM